TSLAPADMTVLTVEGPRGKRLYVLRKWLHGEADDEIGVRPARGATRLRGVRLDLSPEQIRSTARRALLDGQGDPTHYYGWDGLVDDLPVGVKWLMSVVTGLPVRAFGASEARRVLTQLGVEVRSS